MLASFVAAPLLLIGGVVWRWRLRQARPSALVVSVGVDPPASRALEAPLTRPVEEENTPPPTDDMRTLGSEVLEHLRQLEEKGSPGLAAQVIEIFVQDTAARLAALREAVAQRDSEAVYRLAHTLQGSTAIVGAASVARRCAELTAIVRRGSFDRCEAIVADLDAGFEAIKRAVERSRAQDAVAVTPIEVPPPSYSPAHQRKRVLVVDDDDTTRKITQTLVQALGHEVEPAHDGIEALAKLRLGVDLVLLDVAMPGLDGFEVCRRIRRDSHGETVPVIMVTSLASKADRLFAVQAGANDFIAKPIDETELRVRSASVLKMKEAQDALKRYQGHLEDIVEQRTASLRKALEEMAEAQRLAYMAQLETVERLAILAEYKDQVTARHIQRMSEYCAVIARGLKLPPGEVELITHASRMHDVGKIAVPDAILRKPSSLDGPEWKVMRGHPTIGSLILDNSSSQLLQAGRVIALCHHERWDGGGYPSGLVGEGIPLWGRICAVADVFDAVTSERPYKPAYPNDQALQILHDGRATHFDPRVVDVFFENLEEILAVQVKYRDPGDVIG